MNIDFGTSHMETLADLMKIAEKHNCKITFGFASSHEPDIDEEILKKHKFTDEDIEFMQINMTIETKESTFDKLWLELYDGNKKTYNNLVYIESSTYLTVREEYSPSDYPSEELRQKLEENDEMLDHEVYTLALSHNPTIITGFGNEKKIEDFRVYRSGMALKFFGDLVCDYLGEPRISRCY